ncbi:hypothetical protein J4558_25405 [Leptolyngbya sp. 15MV]|nr:hypothetical protein J4558_25405 [Leptolyngbya sp. 15MV]
MAIGVHTHAGCTSPTQGAAGNRGSNWFAITGAVNALNNPLTVARTGRGTPGGSLFALGDAVNNFGTLNTTGGEFAKVSFGPAWSQGLAYAPSAGVFYAVDLNPFNGSQRLWTITPAGVSTQVATLSGSPGAITGLGFASGSGTLYGVASNGARVIINTSTGAVTADGVANPGTAIGAVEFDDASGFLYAIDDAGGASRLVRFTPATGAIEVIGPLGAGIADCNGLAITQEGEFYTINAANEQVLRINPATGAATVVGPTGGLFGSGFGMSAVRAGACYANCDGSTGSPALTPADFVCFLNKFRAGDAYANCDGSTGSPTLTPADFVCFLNAFRTGCP